MLHVIVKSTVVETVMPTQAKWLGVMAGFMVKFGTVRYMLTGVRVGIKFWGVSWHKINITRPPDLIIHS